MKVARFVDITQPAGVTVQIIVVMMAGLICTNMTTRSGMILATLNGVLSAGERVSRSGAQSAGAIPENIRIPKPRPPRR